MKLSLIIPTKNRLAYLKKCLPVAIAGLPDECEIIVGENNCTDGTKEYLAEFQLDSNIVVINSGIDLSMSENFERCMIAAAGKYLLVIGDDDLVVPGQLKKALSIAESLGFPDAILQPDWCMVWPEESKSKAGSLRVEIGMHISPLMYPVNAALARAVREINYVCLPDVYHGMIKRDVFLAYSRAVGSKPLIKACSPDVYLAFALSSFISDVYILPCAYTVKGRSPMSNGASYNSRNNAHRIKEFLDLARTKHASVSGNCFISNLHEHLLVSLKALRYRPQDGLRPSWVTWAWKAAQHTSRCRNKPKKIKSFFQYLLSVTIGKTFGDWRYQAFVLPMAMGLYAASFLYWSVRLIAKKTALKVKNVLLCCCLYLPLVAFEESDSCAISLSFCSQIVGDLSFKYRHPVRIYKCQLPVGVQDQEVVRLLAELASR